MSKYRIVRAVMSQGASITNREEDLVVLANTAPRPAGAATVSQVSDDTAEHDWQPVVPAPTVVVPAPVVLAPTEAVPPTVISTAVPLTEGVI